MKKYPRLGIPVVVAAVFGLAATLALLPASAVATDDLWQDIDRAALRPPSARAMPRAYRTLQLNAEALDQLLARAPQESPGALAQSPAVISLPLPEGGFTRFQIVESSIMEPALAAQFPRIRTYNGQGIDDPAATLRCDLSPNGFRAIALVASGAIYVDPYAPDEPNAYISYYKKDYPREDSSWDCSVLDREPDQARPDRVDAANALALGHGETLRTYRLAVAATGEYTQFHGGTVDRALAAIVTTINRVNAIYQREIAVRFTLVAGEAGIIYTDPNTDPYTNDDGRQLLFENQRNLSAVIGSNNYDIGHVFSTRGGGLAQLRSVCSSDRKAMGQTGSPSPVGDPFDVDYVAHEIGHQFGGNHTFNGATRKCSGNRASSAAYEPGSGSTIQAYAGICGEQDLQPNSDPYFHVKSLEEMTSFITAGGGATCGVLSNTGNAPPAVSAGAEFTIPARTAFTLKATGSDRDGHPLSFAWEQYDLGPASPPDTDDGFRPIFRSFAPRSDPSRTFPNLADLLVNREAYGESLPSTTRRLTFQVTARDNQAQGGAIASATTRINVQAGSRPFAVTGPNASIAWAGGSTETVTWDVANTNAAPINCANVKITLSIDGGNTFPVVLAESTPNDGGHGVLVPNTATTSARIKVEAVGNVFFDIGNASFTITGGSGGSTLALASGVSQTGSIPAPSQQGQGWLGATQWTIQTPGGATQLKVDLSGNPDVDLYVRFGQPVAISNGALVADFKSESETGNETISITPGSSPALQAGTYYIGVVNWGPGAANFTLTAAVSSNSGIEGDVAPRPNGNGTVTITDWVQIGRFVAGQDTPSGSEFQRADTAPRESRGNGSLTITDWVQAGRYAAGVDAPTPAGGPGNQGGFGLAAASQQAQALAASGSRIVRISSGNFERGRQSSVIVELDAEGNENALGFSFDFDTARLRFVSATAGDGAGGATLNVNASRAARGQLGIALALPPGRTLAAGPCRIVVLTFATAPNNNAATAAIGFGDLPVRREVSDVNAHALPASFVVCKAPFNQSQLWKQW